jgi:hypothetical protein
MSLARGQRLERPNFYVAVSDDTYLIVLSVSPTGCVYSSQAEGSSMYLTVTRCRSVRGSRFL